MDSTKKVKSSLQRYVFNTLMLVVPLSLLLGVVSAFILGVKDTQFIVCIIEFGAAGLILGVLASLKNYRKFIKPLNIITELAESLYDNDFTYVMDESKAAAQKEMINSLNTSVTKIKDLLLEMKNISDSVVQNSLETAASLDKTSKLSESVYQVITEFEKGSENQASSLEECSNSISHIVENIEKISNDMHASEKLTNSAKETIKIGEQSVEYQEVKMKENKEVSSRVSKTISELSQKSDEIGQIVNVISEISEQTNLLALNASIEAARAGEQGKGFAVVAGEVKKLAEDSSNSAQKISNLVRDVQVEIRQAVTDISRVESVVNEQEGALQETVKSYRNISNVVDELSTIIKSISQVSEVLDSKSKIINEEMNNIAAISEEAFSSTQNVVASIEEQVNVINQVSASSQKLTDMINSLKENIKKFKL